MEISPYPPPDDEPEQSTDPDKPVIAFLMIALTHTDTVVEDRIKAATLLMAYAHRWKSRDNTMYGLLDTIRKVLRGIAIDPNQPTAARFAAAQGVL